MRKWREHTLLKYSTPSVRIIALALVCVAAGLMILLVQSGVNSFKELVSADRYVDYRIDAITAFAAAFALIIIAVVECKTRSDDKQIRYMIIARLCQPKYGNPLHLRNGQIEPTVIVWPEKNGFGIRIRCPSVDFRKLGELDTAINDCLVGKFWGYAVVSKAESLSGNFVEFLIEDEIYNSQQQNVYDSIDDLRRRYE